MCKQLLSCFSKELRNDIEYLLTVEKIASARFHFLNVREKRERRQAYDPSKFRGICDTIPWNFVTQLLFSVKFTLVLPQLPEKKKKKERQ